MRLGRPDRVPVSLYEMTHLRTDGWSNREPSYAPLLELQQTLGDSFLMTDVDVTHVTKDPNAVRSSREMDDTGVETTTVLPTPTGDLTTVFRRDPSVATNWQIKPYIESADDVRKFLSIPVEPFDVDLAPLRRTLERVGEDGMVLIGPGDPLGNVVGMFHYDCFLMTLLEHEDLILEMLSVTTDRMTHGLKQVCDAFDNVAVRFWGPEYASAPLLNPKVYFPKLVVPFLAPLIEMVNDSGNLSIVHSHGRLDDILETIADMRPSALEPLEVLPATTADVTMADIKRRVGDRVCLMGGLQANELERKNPEYVEARVKDILAAAMDGGGYALIPTASPISIPLASNVVANYEAYFNTARQYGAYV